MKDIVTIIFGDSIAYGLFDEELGWAYRLKKILSNNNYIFNLAIPGQNSEDILNKFEIELKNRYNNIDDFKIIFSFGIKDSLLLSKDNNHLKIFENNVLEIINKTKEYTNKIYFIGLINPDINKRVEYNLDCIAKIDNTIEKICTKEQVNYIKLKDLIFNYELVDGLHPNSIGHKKISEELLKNIF